MLIGTITRWFPKPRNYGFIEVDDGRRKELFFHFVACQCEPQEGMRVEFELGSRNGRDCAQNVRPHKPTNTKEAFELARGVFRTLGEI